MSATAVPVDYSNALSRFEYLPDEKKDFVVRLILMLDDEDDVLTAEELKLCDKSREEMERGEFYTREESRKLLGIE